MCILKILFNTEHSVDHGVDIEDVDHTITIHISQSVLGLAEHHADYSVDIGDIDNAVASDVTRLARLLAAHLGDFNGIEFKFLLVDGEEALDVVLCLDEIFLFSN